MKCFYCGEEIGESEKDKCPYCGKIEVISPLKLVKYILLFLSLLCFIIGPLAFLDSLYTIGCIILGLILLVIFFMIKPKRTVFVELKGASRTSRRLVTRSQLILLMIAIMLILTIIQYFIKL